MIDIILQYLNKHDLEGLIAIGAPDDEYLPEARLIKTILEQVSSKQELHIKVKDMWLNMFGIEGCTIIYNFEPLIEDLWKIKKELNV